MGWRWIQPIRASGLGVWRFLGSLPGAVTVLAVTTAASMAGTAVPPEKAPQVYYGSWPFLALLGLVGLSVLSGVVKRAADGWRRNVGFLLSHVSLALIAFGAALTHRAGVNGSLTLVEGQTAGEFALEGISLRLHGADGQILAEARDASDLSDARLKTPSGVWRVTKFLAHGSPREYLRPGADDAPPAAEVEIGLAGEVRRFCLSNSGDRSLVPLGPMELAYAPVADEAGLERLLAVDENERGELVAKAAAGGSAVLPAEVGREDRLEGCTVRIVEYNPDYVIGRDHKVLRRSDRPNNPALRVQVISDDRRSEQWVFARYPGFKHGNLTAPIELTYRRKTTSRDGLFLVHPSGRPPVLIRREGGGVTLRQELAVNGPAVAIDIPEQRLTVRLTGAEAHGRVEMSYEAGAENDPMALRLEGPGGSVWVAEGRAGARLPGEAQVMAELGPRTVPLGFDMNLRKFEVVTYPGSRRPMDFQSTLAIERADGVSIESVVAMNRPLDLDGWRIYQSGYREGPRMATVLQISRDPGAPWVYAGFAVLIAGIVWVGYIQPRLRDRRNRHGKEHPSHA